MANLLGGDPTRSVSSGHVVTHLVGFALRAPELHCYGGARDAKELENFLFDME